MEINLEQKGIIENNPVALATVDGAGLPNVIAVAYVKVVDEKIVITDNFMSSTKENIQNNPNICLAVWDSDWKGCKIVGKAEYFTEGKWFDFVKVMKENEGYAAKGAIVVAVESVKKLA